MLCSFKPCWIVSSFLYIFSAVLLPMPNLNSAYALLSLFFSFIVQLRIIIWFVLSYGSEGALSHAGKWWKKIELLAYISLHPFDSFALLWYLGILTLQQVCFWVILRHFDSNFLFALDRKLEMNFFSLIWIGHWDSYAALNF